MLGSRRVSPQRTLLLWSCAALLVITANALYSRKGPVAQLTPKTFSKTVLDSDLPAAVEFYAPWCGHCKALAPQYEKAAQNLQGIATVAAVDCDDDSNKQLCGQYNVQGFPTIKIFPSSKLSKAGGKSRRKLPTDYNGARTAKGIADALTAALPSTHISKLKDLASFRNFTSASVLPKIVLYTDKPRTSALYKSLSLRFKDRLAFAEVNSKAADVVEQQGIQQLPKLVVLNGDKTEEYSGKFKAADLIAFLSEQAGSAAADSAADDSQSQGTEDSSKEEAKKQQKQTPQIVRDLNLTDFEGLSEDEDAWLVAFYSDTAQESKCGKELEEWNKLNVQLGGITLSAQVNISSASATEQKQLQGLGLDVGALQKQPCSMQLVLLPFGDKDEPVLFKGNRTAKELQSFAAATFPDIVDRVSGVSLDSAFTGTISHPKVVLCTDKEDTPGVFRALAASFRKYKMLFWTISASDAQAMKAFQIDKVPSVVLAFLPPGVEESHGKNQLSLQKYPGPLKYQYLAGWLTMAASELGMMPEGFQDRDAKRSAPQTADVPEITTAAALKKQCTDLTGLCIIAALDSNASDFESLKATFQASSVASSALHYMWLDSNRQRDFWEGLGVSSGDAPTAVAISPKKRRQASLSAGAFSQEGLRAFAERLVSGKASTHLLQELPKVIDGGQEPLSQEPLVVDEEFDLSDIMGEQLDSQLGSKEDRLRQIQEQEEEEAKRRQEESSEPSKPKKNKKKSAKGGKKKARPTSDEL